MNNISFSIDTKNWALPFSIYRYKSEHELFAVIGFLCFQATYWSHSDIAPYIEDHIISEEVFKALGIEGESKDVHS